MLKAGEYKPELIKMECFGLPQLKTEQEWPTEEDLIPFLYKKVKLNGISWKSIDNSKPISGMQLNFTNEVETPFFETEKGPEL